MRRDILKTTRRINSISFLWACVLSEQIMMVWLVFALKQLEIKWGVGPGP